MLECLILGDSIAVGIAQHRPECTAYAKSGINSKNWVNKNITKELSADTVIISLGSNDLKSTNTLKELFTIRQVVNAKRVYWIMPAIKPEKQEMVDIVADKYEDKIIHITNLSADGVHPTQKGYTELSIKTKGN
jgi:lysophospholipase L1-like esterase